jgi:hypothetical protein
MPPSPFASPALVFTCHLLPWRTKSDEVNAPSKLGEFSQDELCSSGELARQATCNLPLRQDQSSGHQSSSQLPRPHPYPPVETDNFAVQHLVFDDVLSQGRVFIRQAQTGWERNLLG